jgi:hypothetical protein
MSTTYGIARFDLHLPQPKRIKARFRLHVTVFIVGMADPENMRIGFEAALISSLKTAGLTAANMNLRRRVTLDDTCIITVVFVDT